MDKDLRGRDKPASGRLHDQDSKGSANNSGNREEWLDDGIVPGEAILDGTDVEDESHDDK